MNVTGSPAVMPGCKLAPKTGRNLWVYGLFDHVGLPPDEMTDMNE